ncbi:hypothetical protein ABZZ74_47980 [Streptomyces sp. NPDC006476]|uniref:hypothetical protein n=1 Tax=Streptomyces sp. NPDC006476 TaxID=3157175 RepID=UPI0033BB556B
MCSLKDPSRIVAAAPTAAVAALLAVIMAAVPASAEAASNIVINGNLIPADATSVAITDNSAGSTDCFPASRGATVFAQLSVNSGDTVHFDMYRKPGCGDWNFGASFTRTVPDNVSGTWNVN